METSKFYNITNVTFVGHSSKHLQSGIGLVDLGQREVISAKEQVSMYQIAQESIGRMSDENGIQRCEH